VTLLDFLSGAITMGYLIGGLFFCRFWIRTRDALFLHFALAFALLALGQGLLALSGIAEEERSYLYLVRLAAFVIIIFAILRKNLGARRGR
jgi:hypothetical protein